MSGRREVDPTPKVEGQPPALGDVLRQSRRRQGLTLAEVSKLTKAADPEGKGVSRSYLSRVETKKVRRPADSVLENLTQVLGIPYSELNIPDPTERFTTRYTADVVINALRGQFGPEFESLRKIILSQNEKIDSLAAEVQELRNQTRS